MRLIPSLTLATLLVMPAANLHAAGFYASPKGNDANPGTAAKPFATLERARDAVREARSSAPPGEAMTVWLQGGDYPVASSLVLTAEDSGTVYRSVAGEDVRLGGGRAVAAADFLPVTDPATLARLPEAARGKVVELDLTKYGLKHIVAYPDVFTDTGGLIDLYYKDRRMPLARFPNTGYMTMKRVLDNAGGLVGRNWKSGKSIKYDPSGAGGVFEYREEFQGEHAAWQEALDHGVWLKGYWRTAWQNEAIRVESIDTEKHTVSFAKQIGGGIGNKYTRPEGSGEEKYWLMNLLEAVDLPGEWCVDFKDKKLYLMPPASLADGDVTIPDISEPLIKLDGTSRVTFREITIEQGLGNGIQVDNGTENLIAGCTIRNVDRNGVVFAGGARNEVLSCDLYWLGAGGVWLSGGDEIAKPRVPAGHRVVNNHIHHFAQIERVYAAGVNAGFTGGGGGGHHTAVGMHVAHNLIHNTPHVGILHGSWDSVFEYNEISNFCQVSNDMGGWYCYDKFERMGNQTFRYNYVHSSDGGDGVYFDCDHRDMKVYGNIIALNSRSTRGTAFLYKSGSQGQGNLQSINCTNNIAINCRLGFNFVSSMPSRIENNVAVNCDTPFNWTFVSGAKSVRPEKPFAAGKNMTYTEDPGFVNMAGRDFRLRPDSRIFRDLPGFKPIPVDKIGLFVDEYRRRLPTDTEAGRVREKESGQSLNFGIEDRTD